MHLQLRHLWPRLWRLLQLQLLLLQRCCCHCCPCCCEDYFYLKFTNDVPALDAPALSLRMLQLLRILRLLLLHLQPELLVRLQCLLPLLRQGKVS